LPAGKEVAKKEGWKHNIFCLTAIGMLYRSPIIAITHHSSRISATARKWHHNCKSITLIMLKPYHVLALDSIKNQLRSLHQIAHPCSEFVEAVGDEVCVGDFIKFRTVVCVPPAANASPVLRAINFRVSAALGQVWGYFNNEEGNVCCKVNMYLKEEEFLRRVTFPGVAAIPGRIMFAQ
jgi:hypothetical protein